MRASTSARKYRTAVLSVVKHDYLPLAVAAHPRFELVVVADDDLKVVSTPAYMVGPGIADIGKGIEKLVKQIVEWLQ